MKTSARGLGGAGGRQSQQWLQAGLASAAPHTGHAAAPVLRTMLQPCSRTVCEQRAVRKELGETMGIHPS